TPKHWWLNPKFSLSSSMKQIFYAVMTVFFYFFQLFFRSGFVV
ncbi:MAG: hypothetical protein ACI9LN_003497, partial [Saprospiraceae bacterium]